MFMRATTLRIVVAPLLAGAVVACAGNGKKESIGQYIYDSVTTSKVKAKTREDPKLSDLQINAETFKGVVKLSGFVDSANEAKRAVAVAGEVARVRRARNNMTAT